MFENREILILLFIIPVIAVFLLYCFYKKKKNISKFVDFEMLNKISNLNIGIYKLKNILIILSLIFIIIALARPQYGAKTTLISKKAATIVIVMDVSKSMLAEDLNPNRLETSKLVLSNLIAGFNGNKIGIIAFAGTAFWKCPITLDVFSANNFLKSISIDDMPLGGTKIAKALDLALNGTADIPEGAKAIILVTDGEDDDSGLHVLIEKAKKYKTKIYTIGIGNPEGSKIPIRDQQGYIDFIKDENGNVVITKLDEDTLQYIADETGGEYINLSESKDSIFKILQIAHSLDKAKDEASKEVQREDKYQIFLFIGFILFCFALYLPIFKKGNND
ncbi:MAG: VWA domain-containing protein [Endomicrobiaceae bacterium]|nr:VWA domain-containing protein [Endomicrobiaceae bacterium]